MKNFLIALRTLKHYRLYSVVNILGLAMSLACTIVISRYVYREMTVDGFNENLDRIYTILRQDKESGKSQMQFPWNPNNDAGYIDPFADPAILVATEVRTIPDDSFKIGDKQFNVKLMSVDSNFFKIFDYELSLGDRQSVLKDPTAAIISPEFAATHFAGQDPMGKTMIHSSGREVVVKGVMKTPSRKALINFDIVVNEMLQKHWSNISVGFALAAPNVDLDQLNENHKEFMEMASWKSSQRFQFVPLKDLCFNSEYLPRDDMWNAGQRSNLMVLSVVALLVFLIGIFNFINIYTVLMLRRSREIGVQKVFGASTFAIVRTVYVENLVMIALSVALGWVVIELCKGMIASKIGIPQVGSWDFDIGLTVAIMLVLPILTTIYPYFKYRYAKPITSLRTVAGGRSSIISRAVFLVLQYIITIVMIIVSLFFVRQLNFMLSTDLGINTDNIIKAKMWPSVTSYDRNLTDQQWQAEKEREDRNIQYIKQQMDASPLFVQWCYGNIPINLGESSGSGFSYNGGQFKDLVVVSASPAWFDMFGVKYLNGEQFNDTVNTWKDYKLIATPAAMNMMGATDFRNSAFQPQKRRWWSSMPDAGDMSKNPPYAVIGLVSDLRTEHLSRSTLPIVFTYDDGSPQYDFLLARIVEGKQAEAIDFIRKIYDKTVGGQFEYSFAKHEVEAMYEADRQVSTIYMIFAVIAIFISSLGLFSLSLYNVQQRYREIAIRRVNGATVREIVVMLLRKYYLLLGVSFVIAMPVAWFAIDWYMKDFATKASLSWWIFVVAALVTAAISLLTLIYQTLKAARTNPSVAMKSE